MATSAASSRVEELKALAAQINAAVDAYSNGHAEDTDEIARRCAKMLHRAETPAVFAERVRYQPMTTCALIIAIEGGMLQTIAIRTDQVTTADQLAEICHRPKSDIIRIFRLLTSIGACDEVGPQQYQPNDKTTILATQGQIGGFRVCSVVISGLIRNLEEYFSKSAAGQVDLSKTTPYEYTYGKPLYEHMRTNGLRADFDAYMDARKAEKKRCWHMVYPAEQALASADSSTTIVDVAGSHGHDLLTFHAAVPNFPGRLILQELPEVINSIPADQKSSLEAARVEVTQGNFFEPQPVRGASLYLLFAVVHNWPDAACVSILKNLASAMTPRVSRLIFSAMLLPDVGASRRSAELDLQMWVLLLSRQRSETEVRGLLAEAGLEIVNVWGERDRECIIEAWRP